MNGNRRTVTVSNAYGQVYISNAYDRVYRWGRPHPRGSALDSGAAHRSS